MLGPDDLARGFHGDSGFFTTEFDDDRALVVTQGNVITALLVRDTPGALETVVEGVFEAVGIRVPDADGTVLGAGHDDGQLRMERGKVDILAVTFEGLDAVLVLVVPDLDQASNGVSIRVREGYPCQCLLVIGTRNQVGFVTAVVIVNKVDALLVPLEGEVGHVRAERPNLDDTIETSRGECVGVFRVEGQVHHKVGVTFKDLQRGRREKEVVTRVCVWANARWTYLNTLPALLPVPQTNGHVIRAREKQRLSRMDSETADIVGVAFKAGDLFVCVVVENTDLRVV